MAQLAPKSNRHPNAFWPVWPAGLAQLAPKCGTIRPKSLAQLKPKWVAQLAPDYPIEAAAKMAQLLGVSLDWLVGHTDLELDRMMIQRIEEVSKMDATNKAHVFAMLDAFIKQTKLQSVLQ